MSIAVHQEKKKEQQSHSSVIYYVLCLIALALIFVSIWWAYLPIITGINRLPDFVSLRWAHESLLLETLLVFLIMIWFVASAFFWCGWLLRRSVRKIKGQHWLLATDDGTSVKGKFVAFFPPVLSYLKISCYYLVFVFVFVVLQYPLQYLLF